MIPNGLPDAACSGLAGLATCVVRTRLACLTGDPALTQTMKETRRANSVDWMVSRKYRR
jgi:hypothetical protein